MPAKTGILLRLLMLAGAMQFACGCAATPSAATRHFSLTLFVDGQDNSTNPLAQTARYLVLENRQLHVLLGRPARDRTFPPPYRPLSVDEFDRVVRFVDDHHLLAEPTSPAVLAAQQQAGGELSVRYEVHVIRNGRSNRYETTPKESPPTTALLAALSSFRGADLSKASLPE